MAEPTFDCPDLDSFCLLDRLGLSVTGQHIDIDHTVLACRVVEPDDVTPRSCWCTRCGELGLPRDTVLRRLAHVPIGWRPTLLHVAVRRYRCLRCGHVWRQDTTAAAEPRSKLSRSAVLWASWHTVNVAVLTAGRALLIEDPTRVEGVRDLTSVPAGAGPARLLDMVSGRSRAVFTTWLNRQCPAFLAGIETVAMDGFTGYTSSATEAVPDAVAVMNPFHVVALAGDATGPLLPTPAAGDLWAPRPDRDPVYGSRRVLGAGAGLLTN